MNAIAELQPPRLPYHAAVQDRFGVDRGGWKALVEAVYPLAKTPDAVIMALSYCKARKLDPFKKPVHIVPMWDSKKRDYVETIWPGISEVRTTAFRTGQYAGCDEAEFGPTIEKSFSGKVKKRDSRDSYEEQTVEVAFPEWCRMTVYRVLGERVCKFVGPKVKWLESYATIGNTDLPNDMWQSRPEGQIEKCAEAAALRKAFPEELGNQLTAEEMEGRRVEGDFGNAEITEPAKRQPPAPANARAEVEDAEVVEQTPSRRAPPKPAYAKQEPTKVSSGRAQQQEAYDAEARLAEIEAIFARATNEETLEALLASEARPIFDGLKKKDQDSAIKLYEGALARLMDAGGGGDASGEAEGAGASDAADENAYDPEPILAKIQKLFDECESEERLELVREKQVLPLIERLSRSDQERGKHIYNLAQKRIADAAASEGAGSDFPGDRQPPKPAAKDPAQMSAKELIAYHEDYIASWTGPADDLKARFRDDADLRDEVLSPDQKKALRGVWNEKMGELREREG